MCRVPSDRRDVRAKFGMQSDVTHIFYEARFDHVEGTPEPIDTNVAMFQNLIDTVVPIATNLEHVHTGSGHKNYGLHKGPARTPAREDAPGITRSMISLICAYAAIRKELGLLFSFLDTEGNYHALYQCTEALQLAKATVWMATAPACANQDFNITSRDLCRCSNLWPKFADYFSMALRPVGTVNLADYMTDKEAFWQRVIEGHTLISQSPEQVAMWSYWRYLWKLDWDIVSSRTKARQLGFHDIVDSEAMFVHMFDHFRVAKVFP